MTKSKAVTLTVSVPADWLGWLEREVRRRQYANRSELVREAVRRMLGEHERDRRVVAA